jgi:hypothetical protein
MRRLAFGDESLFRHHLGLAIAGFDVPNAFSLDHSGLIYNESGRLVMVTSGRDRALRTLGGALGGLPALTGFTTTFTMASLFLACCAAVALLIPFPAPLAAN